MDELREELVQQIDAVPADVTLSLGVPMHVLLGEAVDLAAFVRRVWEPADGHPGLSSAARHFGPEVADDLVALVGAVQQLHTAFRLAAAPPISRDDVDRAVALLDELTAVLQFHFDDGVEDERDAQLEAVDGLYGERSTSDDALAAALYDYATLAGQHREALAGLGGFEPDTIDEALSLSAQVRARSAQLPSERAQEAKAHRIRRDQTTAVLDRTVKQVRAAARFAFRAHPSLAREVGSAYGRRARAAARRRAQAEAEVAEPTPAGT